MQYIVAALDSPWPERIEELWGEIVAVTGQKQLAGARRPHLVLHVAERYDDGIHAAMGRIAAEIAPFDVATGRIGVFHASHAAIALEIIRSHDLDRLHERVWRDAGALAHAPKDVYAPETWAPHVTIATATLDDAQIEVTLELLARRSVPDRIAITNICLIPRERSLEWRRFDFGATHGAQQT